MYGSNQDSGCSIYNKSFLNDLQTYRVEYENLSSNKIQIIYDDGMDPTVDVSSKTFDIEINMSGLNTIISETEDLYDDSSEQRHVTGMWYPAFITVDQSDQNKKGIIDKIDFKEPSLGINSFIKFVGKFNSWTTKDTNGSEVDRNMESDWRLTNKYNNFMPQHGILCWYKKSMPTGLVFRDMPIGSIFYPYGQPDTGLAIASGHFYQKTDHRTAKDLGVDRSQIDGTNITFTEDQELINFLGHIRGSGDNNFPYQVKGQSSIEADFAHRGWNLPSFFDNNVDSIYIPDGEAFAFYDNQVDRDRTQLRSLPSFSYLSPSLHNIYREVFHALYPYDREDVKEAEATAVDIIKDTYNITYGYGQMTEREARAFNLLCNFLSTAPQIDRVTINSYSDVYNKIYPLIWSFIHEGAILSGASDQFSAIAKLIRKIINIASDSQYVKINNTSPESAVDNPISLFHRITSKYAPELTLQPNEDTNLVYVDTIEGSLIHYTFSNIASTYYDPETNDIDNTLYNNYEISLSSVDSSKFLSYSTDFTSSGTEAQILGAEGDRSTNKTLYYADAGIPAKYDTVLYLGSGYLHTGVSIPENLRNYSEGSSYSTSYDDTTFKDPIGPDFDTQYSWKIKKGPYGLRFHNLDSVSVFGTPFRFGTYNNSNDAEPGFAMYASGCQTERNWVDSLPGFPEGGYLSSCAGNEDLSTWEIECTRNVGAFSQVDRVIFTTHYNYLLDADLSNNYQGDDGIIQFRKINCGIANSIGFDKAGIVWLIDTPHFINIGDISFNDGGNSECLRAKDVKLFIDASGQNDQLFKQAVVKDLNLQLTYKPGNTTVGLYSLNISHLRSYCYPNCASTYEEKVFRKKPLWLTDPDDLDVLYTRGHNLTRGDIIAYEVDENGSTTSNSTEFTWHNDSDKVAVDVPVYPYGDYNNRSAILGNTMIPDHIPGGAAFFLDKRNPVLDPTGIFCYRENLPITGNEILLDKGLFLPNLGFVYPEHYAFIDNRSYALEDRTEKYRTHIFDGRGFYDLRPNATYYSSSLAGPSGEKAYLNTIKSSIYINPEKYVDARTFGGGDNRRKADLYGYKEGSWPPAKDASMYLRGNSTSSGYDEELSTGELEESYDLYESESLEKLIKNIEVNLNFLNYQNPQNLRFILEMYHGEEETPYQNTYSMIDQGTVESTPAMQKYITDLEKIHAFGKICLLNLESIKNYQPNYVLRFSDFYNKYTMGQTREKYNSEASIGMEMPHQSTSSNLLDHNNEEKLPPTLCASSRLGDTWAGSEGADGGYPYISLEGLDNSYLVMINAIKNNSKLNSKFSLSKFRGKKLGSLKAKLRVDVLNPFDYRTTIMDNLLSNDILSNLKSTDKRTTSNTINNSLCNWELIVHVDDEPDYHRKDTLGKIDYKKRDYVQNSLGPFNYIFKPNKKIVPSININAPYKYITGVSDCSYYDALNDLLGDTLADLVGFPNLLSYLLLVASFFGVTTGLGAMNGLITLSTFYGNGGINDPIVGYFIRQAIAQRVADLNRQYYRPVYRNFSFGKSDTVVVGLSNNKSAWYVSEVPIFSYNNTPAGKTEELIYVKLHKHSVFSGLGSFYYKKLSYPSDLDIINCNYIIDEEVTTLAGTPEVTVTIKSDTHPDEQNKTVQLKAGDVVKLTKQSDVTYNGYWLVRPDSWVSFLSNSDGSEIFKINHKIGHTSFDNDTSSEGQAFNTLSYSSNPNIEVTINSEPDYDAESEAINPIIRTTTIKNTSYYTQNNISITNNIPTGAELQDVGDAQTASNTSSRDFLNNNTWIVETLAPSATEWLRLRLQEIAPAEEEDDSAGDGGAPPPPPPPGLPEEESSTSDITTKHIIIDGYRGYYFFDIGQTVLDGSNTEAVITNKSLIATNAGYKTILSFEEPVYPEGRLGLPATSCNSILVFNPTYNTSDNKSDWTSNIDNIYKWPMEEHKQGLRTNNYNSYSTATAEGSIGYGTDVVRPGKLDTEQKINESFSLYEQANNSVNDYYKYFNFNLNNGTYFTFNQSDSLGDKLRAYRYSIEDIGLYSTDVVSKEFSLLERTAYDANTTPDPKNYDEFKSVDINNTYQPIYLALEQLAQQDFIEIKTNKLFNQEDINIADTGTITIDADLNFNNKVVRFDSDNYSRMIDFYDEITGTGDYIYNNITEAMDGNNIRALNAFYNTLSADPIKCYSSNDYNFEDCPAMNVKQRIVAKKKEADDIFHASGIATTSTTVAAHISGLALFANGGIEIKYNDTDLYWIHIDPENGCFVSNEMSVKIPVSTELQVLPINRSVQGTVLIEDSQMSPLDNNFSNYAIPDKDTGQVKLTDRNGGNYLIEYTDTKQQEIKNAWLQVDPTLNFSNMVDISIGSTSTSQVDINKMMFGYGESFNDTLFAWEDFYERPAALGSTYIDYQLKEVIDFGKPVYMKFRVMPPRKLKSHDQRFKRYLPTSDGGLGTSVIPPSTNYDLAADFYCWRCVDHDGEYVDTPPFYQMMNEMIFRGFFGSNDKIEQTNKTILTSQEPWEWIPYDFKPVQSSAEAIEGNSRGYVVEICNANAITDDNLDIVWNGSTVFSSANMVVDPDGSVYPSYRLYFLDGTSIGQADLIMSKSGACNINDVRGRVTLSPSEFLESNEIQVIPVVDQDHGNWGTVVTYKLNQDCGFGASVFDSQTYLFDGAEPNTSTIPLS